MARFTLRRHRDGHLIETNSASEANDLVANGVAERVTVAPKPSIAKTPAPSRSKRVVTDDELTD